MPPLAERATGEAMKRLQAPQAWPDRRLGAFSLTIAMN
jgi:hypothetical protein